jgi:hypothetical protein
MLARMRFADSMSPSERREPAPRDESWLWVFTHWFVVPLVIALVIGVLLISVRAI